MSIPIKTLKNALKVCNPKWQTQYYALFKRLFLSQGLFVEEVCSLEDLKAVLVDDDCLVLDFGDDCPVNLESDGYEFGEKGPLTVSGSQEATHPVYHTYSLPDCRKLINNPMERR
jgi:hypothetical protein